MSYVFHSNQEFVGKSDGLGVENLEESFEDVFASFCTPNIEEDGLF